MVSMPRGDSTRPSGPSWVEGWSSLETLRRCEEQVHRTLDGCSTLVALSDSHASVRYANAAWARVLGRTPDAYLGTATLDLVQPDDLPVLKNALRTLCAEPGTRKTCDLRLRHAGGQYVHIEFTSVNLLDDPVVQAIVTNGHETCAAKTAQEVDAEVERRVAERTVELMELYNNAPCGYHSTEPDGTYLRINDTELRLLGYEREELIGTMRMVDLLPPTSRELFDRTVGQKLNHGTVENIELEMICKNGSLLPVRMSLVAVQDAQGQWLRTHGALFDNTVPRRIRDELDAQNETLTRINHAKSEFLASAGHDLRTPLNAVLGFTEMLAEEIHGTLNMKQRSMVSRIDESGRHLLAQLNNIIDLSKIEAGKVELQLAPVNVRELCSASLRAVRDSAERKCLQLLLQLDERVPSFLGDERRIKQILLQLLSNAVKFTEEGGSVELKTSLEADWVCFTVGDTGVGITPADQSRLFQSVPERNTRFSRPHIKAGLGLLLVQRLTELQGGTVSLESELGRGTRFSVRLPVTPDPMCGDRGCG